MGIVRQVIKVKREDIIRQEIKVKREDIIRQVMFLGGKGF